MITDRSDLTLQTPESFFSRFHVNMKVRHEVTAIHPEEKTVSVKNLETGEEFEESYDKLILSPGAKPTQPRLPGVGLDKLFTPVSYTHLDVYKSQVYHTLVSHTMLLGDCLIVLNMFGDVADNIQNMARMFSWIDETALHVEDYRSFMEKPQTIVAEGAPKPVPALADIHVSDASFAYDGAKANVIDDMNLDIRKGEKIALVGENGAGKTTLVKLLLRLYDVQAGSVNVGGTNIRRYDPRQYLSLIHI